MQAVVPKLRHLWTNQRFHQNTCNFRACSHPSQIVASPTSQSGASDLSTSLQPTISGPEHSSSSYVYSALKIWSSVQSDNGFLHTELPSNHPENLWKSPNKKDSASSSGRNCMRRFVSNWGYSMIIVKLHIFVGYMPISYPGSAKSPCFVRNKTHHCAEHTRPTFSASSQFLVNTACGYIFSQQKTHLKLIWIVFLTCPLVMTNSSPWHRWPIVL
jgi:hypothetical protein